MSTITATTAITASGADFTTTSGCDVWLASDMETQMVYPLTPCCGASGKGSGDGVVCRGCYQPVSDWYGAAATNANELGDIVNALAPRSARGRECSGPQACAEHMWWALIENNED